MNIGNRIRASRNAAKLSQAELADKCGLHVNSVGKYENGINSPPFEAIVKIATALDITIAELVGERDTQVLAEKILIEDLLNSKRQALSALEEKRLDGTATAEEKVACYELPIEIKSIEGAVAVLQAGLGW